MTDTVDLALQRWRRRGGRKVCTRCKESLPLTSFGPDARTKDARRSWCRPCDADDTRRRVRFTT